MSTNNILFKIKNLSCSYNNGKSCVLKIKELEIPRGKLIIMLGKSGAGKSTILETLGLMNMTISKGSLDFFLPNCEKIDFTSIWKNEHELSKIRNDHMSFIFQNTNLMTSFSAFENACIPQLLQGAELNTAMNNVNKVMTELGLQEVGKNTKVNELSGGQRQRLAFVRAITAEFTILFGDEPTGNLDEQNSRELMRKVKDQLIEKGGSSILVTHNIKLATEFADMILVLTKTKEYGEILPENVFMCKNHQANKTWENLKGEKFKQIENTLHEKLL